VSVPSAGGFVARGFCAFAPGSVRSGDAVRILTVGSAGEEIPSVVHVAASWPDGSVKLAEIAFGAKADREGPVYFWVEYGPGVRRGAGEPSLPAGPSEGLYFEEAEVPSPAFDLGAGMLLVRVEQHPDLWYYAYLVPAGAIVALLVWRKVKLSR